MVYAVRAERDETALRKAGFKTFYRVWRMFSNVEVPLDAGEFAIMRRSVVDAVLSSPEITLGSIVACVPGQALSKSLTLIIALARVEPCEQKFNIVKDTILGLEAVLSFFASADPADFGIWPYYGKYQFRHFGHQYYCDFSKRVCVTHLCLTSYPAASFH